MTRSIVLFTMVIVTINSANAQKLKLIEGPDEIGNNVSNVWTYSVTGNPDTTLVVRLELPRCAYVRLVSNARDTLRQERLGTGNLIRLEFPDTNSTFTFEVIASKSETKNGEIDWTIEAKPENIKGTICGPIALYDTSILRFVIATGLSWRSDDIIDFKMQNGVILIENDSKWRPSLALGALLRIAKPVDLLLSFEFASATSKVLDGFVGGLGVELNKYLEIYVGGSVRIGQEVSFGFNNAAQVLAREIQELPDTTDENIRIKQDFLRFNKNNKDFESDKYYDGFSTISPITKEPIFPGEPLNKSTNWALMIGFALPIDIFNLIRNKSQ